MTESTQEAFDRGSAAGKIEARLAEHDVHLTRINGSMERVAEELHSLTLAMQSLRDDARATAATTITTALALKEAEAARRDKAESSWSPVGKLLAVLGGLAALAAVAGFVVVILR